MTSTCPNGHQSEADDYCDVCGAPIGAAATTGGPAPGGSAPGGSASGGGAGGSGGGAGGAAGSGAAAAGSVLDLDAPAPSGGGRTCPHCGAESVPGALFCEDCGYDFTTGQLPRTDQPAAAGGPPPLPPTAPAGGPPPLQPPAGVVPTGPAPTGTPPVPTAVLPADLAAAGATSAAPSGATAAPAAGAAASNGPVDWVAEIWVDPDWHAAQDVSEPCPSPGMPVVVGLRGTSLLIGRRSMSRNIHPEIDCGADTGVSRRHAQLTTDGQRWWVEDLNSANGTYVGSAGAPLPDLPVVPGQRSELPEDARIYLGAWTRLVIRAATAQEKNDLVTTAP